MIELYQLPYSPYCIVIRRILEYSRARWRAVNIPNGDRTRIWRLTRRRYYAVPVIRCGRVVVFETHEHSQVIAKYLDFKFGLGLFPREWEGVQSLLWRYFEHDIEEPCFKLNDAHWQRHVKGVEERLRFVRHKERKFGRGCLEQWRAQEPELQRLLAERLAPCDRMLVGKPYLLGERPLFVDFDLYGMLGTYLYSGHYRLPPEHPRLEAWHDRMRKLQPKSLS
jgi:glutathione S-transferase